MAMIRPISGLKRHSHNLQQEETLDIVGHFDTVHDRIEVILKSSKGLLNLVKRRVALEKERIRALNKLSSAVNEEAVFKSVYFSGVLGDSWKCIRDHLQSEALHRSHTIGLMEERVIQTLSVFLLSDLEKRFQTITQDFRQLVRDYQSQRMSLNRAKEKYHGCCTEWESVLLQLHKEFGSSWQPIPGHKLFEKEQQVARKTDEARQEYTEMVEVTNNFQNDLCFSQLPHTLMTMRETAEQMISVVQTALKSFEMQQVSLIGNLNIQLSGACEDVFIIPEYCQKSIFFGVDGDKISSPQPFNFCEYSFKDNALQVQARKMQYRAMSLLSPQEMMTRGAMFFANQDSKNSDGGHVTTHKVKGLNSYLVEVCVEFLKQDDPMNEEGLFRVPGDSSVIKGIHEQFMTFPQDKEELRALVMGQMDPNNVSGLLKLHLRQNPILSSTALAVSQDALAETSSHGERTRSLVIEQLSTCCTETEFSVLAQVVDLLSCLVQEPWKLKNKMTPRTLGIACGLSLFPSLDPGQATLLLEHLMHYSADFSQEELVKNSRGSNYS